MWCCTPNKTIDGSAITESGRMTVQPWLKWAQSRTFCNQGFLRRRWIILTGKRAPQWYDGQLAIQLNGTYIISLHNIPLHCEILQPARTVIFEIVLRSLWMVFNQNLFEERAAGIEHTFVSLDFEPIGIGSRLWSHICLYKYVWEKIIFLTSFIFRFFYGMIDSCTAPPPTLRPDPIFIRTTQLNLLLRPLHLGGNISASVSSGNSHELS